MERDVARAAFADGRYALADVFLVSDIDAATLRSRRDSDPLRTRRNFERHILLRDALLRWYRAVEELEPGRVVFGLPEDPGIPPSLVAKGRRAVRSGPRLFDALLSKIEER
jgi:hypothetical protein